MYSLQSYHLIVGIYMANIHCSGMAFVSTIIYTVETKVPNFSKGRVGKEKFTHKNSIVENVRKKNCYRGFPLSKSGTYKRAKVVFFSEQ